MREEDREKMCVWKKESVRQKKLWQKVCVYVSVQFYEQRIVVIPRCLPHTSDNPIQEITNVGN